MLMGSSVSIVTEHRRNLYWGKYKYCIHFTQQKVSVLRHINNIDKSIEGHRHWERQRHNSGWAIGSSTFRSEFTDDVVKNLHFTADCIQPFMSEIKTVFSSWNHGYIYTNDEKVFEAIESLPHVKVVSKKVAEVSIPPDTILLNEPKYQFRTYFKSRQLSKAARQRFKDWLTSQGSEIDMATSLKAWVKHGYSRWSHDSEWTQDYWFINHNNKSYETMLGMIAPGLVRKTMILQRR
jgi:hypothetical protein